LLQKRHKWLFSFIAVSIGSGRGLTREEAFNHAFSVHTRLQIIRDFIDTSCCPISIHIRATSDEGFFHRDKTLCNPLY
jgi:hypothetical protein